MSAPAIITPLVQRGGHDCGIAAIATSLDLPYEDVRRTATSFYPTCLDQGLSTREALRILRKHGHSVKSQAPLQEWDGQTGLLLVKRHRAGYHWVSLFAGVLIDPMNGALYLPEAYLRSNHAKPYRFIVL